jgi:uncharacterized protein HemY
MAIRYSQLNGMEIGTSSNEFFENLSTELRRSPTVSATYSLKLLKIGSKHFAVLFSPPN